MKPWVLILISTPKFITMASTPYENVVGAPFYNIGDLNRYSIETKLVIYLMNELFFQVKVLTTSWRIIPSDPSNAPTTTKKKILCLLMA